MDTFEFVIATVGTFLFFLPAWLYPFFGNTWLYTITEGTYIGGSCAVGIVATLLTLKSIAFTPVAGGDLMLIIPIAIGLLAFSRFTKYRWAARYNTALLTGVSLGVAVGASIYTDLLGQVSNTIIGLVAGKPSYPEGIFMFIGTCTIITHFLYSIFYSKELHTGKLRHVSTIGRMFVYLALGSLLGKYLCGQGPHGKMITIIRRWYDEFILFFKL